MRTNKIGTVALVIQKSGQASPQLEPQTGKPEAHPRLTLLENITDEREIETFEKALVDGSSQPLRAVHELRETQRKEDEDFGDYVEDLLSQPFVRPEIQEHGVQWLKSKIRIEQFQRSEAEAAKIIAEYAFRLFTENPDRTDFFLAGPSAKVRIRIFVILEVAGAEPHDKGRQNQKDGGDDDFSTGRVA